MCSTKKVFFKVLQNSQENISVGTLFEKKLRHSCFLVNFAEFLAFDNNYFVGHRQTAGSENSLI